MATARKSWVARALDKAAKSPEAQAAARDMVALALAPVTPAPAPVFPALVEGLGSPEVRVTLEPADVEPRARGRRHQREAAAGLRGRVAAVRGLFLNASNELGAFESGMAAALIGVAPAVWGGGLVTLAVVGATAWLAPELRRLDLTRFARGHGG